MNVLWKNASKSGDDQAILDLLDSGADVNARDRYGQTALMLSALSGYTEVVEILIAYQADLNITAKYGLSALMLALIAGHTDVAELLVKAGANLSLRASGVPGFAGKTAYDLAVERGMLELSVELEPIPMNLT